MKKLLTIFSILFSLTVGATNYYVASAGSDAAAGTIGVPWQTLAKVSAHTFAAGDSMFFNRGDVFYGMLTISHSGAVGNPVWYGAYGTGVSPVISGFTNVSAWTNLGSNIWESTSTVSALPYCYLATVNGVNTGMGRFPNTGFLTYQTFVTNTTITSSSLNSSVTNWTGAEVVIKKQRWVLDRNPITAHSSTTLTYTPASTYYGQANWGFFIQNDLRTLDTLNEWYYNPSTHKIDIYETSTPPTVRVTSVDTLVYTTNKNYITFDHINFQGANANVFYIENSHDFTIQYCSFNFNYNGIYGENYGASTNFKVINDTINNSNNDAIYANKTFSNIAITGNLIKNTATIAGMSGSSDNMATGMFLNNLPNGLVQYNEIDTTGYDGIDFANGDSLQVLNNFINYFCFVKDDGGGIYTLAAATHKIISGNIILNGIGNGNGINNPGTSQAHGVYLDQNGLTSGVQVLNNSIAQLTSPALAGYSGIFVHDAINITVTGNTVYNYGVAQIYIKNDISGEAITGFTSKNNIFFSKDSIQYCLFTRTLHNDISSYGTMDSNYYVRPIADSLVFNTEPLATTDFYYTLAGWQTLTSYDAHSHKSPKTITTTSDLLFEYNPTQSPLIIFLPYNYIDAKGINYNGEITLAPYTSAVLIKNGAIANNIIYALFK